MFHERRKEERTERNGEHTKKGVCGVVWVVWCLVGWWGG